MGLEVGLSKNDILKNRQVHYTDFKPKMYHTSIVYKVLRQRRQNHPVSTPVNPIATKIGSLADKTCEAQTVFST